MTTNRNQPSSAAPTVVLILLLLFGLAVNLFVFLDGVFAWGVLGRPEAPSTSGAARSVAIPSGGDTPRPSGLLP